MAGPGESLLAPRKKPRCRGPGRPLCVPTRTCAPWTERGALRTARLHRDPDVVRAGLLHRAKARSVVARQTGLCARAAQHGAWLGASGRRLRAPPLQHRFRPARHGVAVALPLRVGARERRCIARRVLLGRGVRRRALPVLADGVRAAPLPAAGRADAEQVAARGGAPAVLARQPELRARRCVLVGGPIAEPRPVRRDRVRAPIFRGVARVRTGAAGVRRRPASRSPVPRRAPVRPRGPACRPLSPAPAPARSPSSSRAPLQATVWHVAVLSRQPTRWGLVLRHSGPGRAGMVVGTPRRG